VVTLLGAARDKLDVPIDIKVAAVKHLAQARYRKNAGNARVLGAAMGVLSIDAAYKPGEGIAWILSGRRDPA
jgi:hypothetical protein